MKYINWCANVNKRILDSTKITIGNNGYFDNKSESGNITERSLTSIIGLDTFSVVMDFDWLEKDTNGDSEFDRFVKWYKFNHQRGTNPFYFPSITNFTQVGSTKNCLYKITSALSPEKSGFSMRVSMTWEEVYSGILEVSLSEQDVDHILIEEDGRIEIVYTGIIQSTKTLTSHTIQYKKVNDTDWTTLTLTQVTQTGESLFYNYTPVCESGYTYDFRLDGSSLDNMNCRYTKG